MTNDESMAEPFHTNHNSPTRSHIMYTSSRIIGSWTPAIKGKPFYGRDHKSFLVPVLRFSVSSTQLPKQTIILKLHKTMVIGLDPLLTTDTMAIILLPELHSLDNKLTSVAISFSASKYCLFAAAIAPLRFCTKFVFIGSRRRLFADATTFLRRGITSA